MVTAADQQVALARSHRAGSSDLNRTARQVVPAFLQKLREMVNDPTTDDLIRWSDTGDSFFVLDHERFAREVLGRWFKHQNFSSFVRQLNMYGFHKIPHLQQGVLRSDTDTEFWNFEHPSFHRGQPDLLCLIQRKKQVTQPGDEPMMDTASSALLTPAAPTANLSAGQILDINAIVNGISAIKRHQTTISADLNELKNSNQELWREALASRERHKKQQDTINRILKFLASVFGHNTASVRKDDEVDHPPSRVVSLKPQRLMIDQGPRRGHKGKGVGITEIEDEDMPPTPSYPQRGEAPSVVSEQHGTIETPTTSAGNSPHMNPSEPFSPTISEASTHFSSARQVISDPSRPGTFTTGNPLHRMTGNHTAGEQPPRPVPSALTPVKAAASSTPDASMQAAFAEMLNAPGQMQRLLAALSSHPNYPLSDPSPPGADQHPSPSSQLTSYEPQYDFTRLFAEHPEAGSTAHPLLPSPSDKDESVTSFNPLLDTTHAIQKGYQDKADIDKDVEGLSANIKSLIENLGLDPNLVIGSETEFPALNQHSLGDATVMPPTLHEPSENPAADFDFDKFLNTLSGPDESPDFGDMASTAFLDERTPSSDMASPMTLTHDTPELSARPIRKRKSDIAGLDEHLKSITQSVDSSKSKRKR